MRFARGKHALISKLRTTAPANILRLCPTYLAIGYQSPASSSGGDVF